MPEVPRYGDPRVQERGVRFADVPTDIPASATAVGLASERVQQAAQGFFEQERQRAEEAQFLDLDAQASKVQLDIEGRARQMQGKDAIQATDFAQKEWEKQSAELMKGATGRVQGVFQRSLAQRFDSMNRSVRGHANTETERYYDESAQNSINASIEEGAAKFNDASEVSTILERQRMILSGLGARKGWDEAMLATKLKDVQSKTISAVIDRTLDDNNLQDARSLFEDNKDLLTEDEKAKIGTVILGRTAWEEYGDLELEDGRPDEAAMYSAVLGMKDVPEADRDKAWKYVQARAGEKAVDITKAQNANDRAFLNSVIQGKNAGAPVDDALKAAVRFGRDEYDRALKADLARKLYAPAEILDKRPYVDLWERTQAGGDTKKSIDQAAQAGLISPGDWESLRKDYYNNFVTGQNPAMQGAWDRIKLLAEETYGDDKKTRAEFLYEMKVSGEGKKPEELWKMANDKLGEATPGAWFESGKRWKADAALRDIQESQLGELNEPMVREWVQQGWDIGDIKAGTPVHNAVKSLVRRGKPVTPANVRAIIAQNPDGNW
jgi:hypothetical protein